MQYLKREDVENFRAKALRAADVPSLGESNAAEPEADAAEQMQGTQQVSYLPGSWDRLKNGSVLTLKLRVARLEKKTTDCTII